MSGSALPLRLRAPSVVLPRFLTDAAPPFTSLEPSQYVGDDAGGETGMVLPFAQAGAIWPRLRCVVIAETLPLFRDALAQLARSQSPGAIIVRAGSVAEILELASDGVAPDLFLIDLALPGLDICMALPELRRQHRKAAIITLSTEEDPAAIARSMRSGSDGFVHKAVPRGRCIEAIGRVLAGEHVIEPERSPSARPACIGDTGIVLTRRQREVLTLLAKGASNKLIARELGISHLTVRLHVSALLRIFGVTRRNSVAPKARLIGMLGPSPEAKSPVSPARTLRDLYRHDHSR